MKKYVSILLAVVMLVICAVPMFASAADEAVAIEVTTDKTEVRRGDTITVTVSLTKNPGMSVLQISPELGEGLGIQGRPTKGPLVEGDITPGLNFTVDFGLVDENDPTYPPIDQTATGVILTFKVAVAANAPAGEAAIDIIFRFANSVVLPRMNTADVKNTSVTIINPAQGITVTPATASLKTGETTKLTAELDPADATDSVTWTSSDTSVATVAQDGTVTALKKGTATITAATSSGHTAAATVTVACSHTGTTHLVGDKGATCAEEGYTGDTYCDACGEKIADGTAIGKTAHPGTTELVKNKEATCTEAGYTGDKVCTVCGEVIEEGTVIPAKGHSEDTRLVNAKDPTCTEAGYTGDEVCAVCGEIVVKGDAIPAIGHDFEGQEVHYWPSIDGSQMMAFRECKNDPSHHEEETVDFVEELAVEPTKDAPGEITYTATFTNPAFETQIRSISVYLVSEEEMTYDPDTNTEGLTFTVYATEEDPYAIWLVNTESGEEIVVPDDQFTAKDGVITISDEFVKKLEAGEFGIVVYVDEGVAIATVSVSAPKPVDRPTGDSALSLALFSMVALISLAGATVAGVKIKKASK